MSALGSSDGGPEGSRRLLASVLPSAGELAHARRRLHVKAAGIVVADVVAFAGVVAPGTPGPWRGLCGVVLVHALLATATGVMHDANHGAFARRRWANQALSYSADVLGASSWLWRFQHNELHHRHTNVEGVDNDIDQAPFARLSPSQAWRPWHRWQHLYLWPLYGLLTAQWFVASDWRALASGGLGEQRFRSAPRRRDVGALALGKVVHAAWALALPMVWHAWWTVLAWYLVSSWLVGFGLAVVFQVAHCVDRAEFTDVDVRRRGDDFVRHQLATTVDVELGRGPLGAYLGFLSGGLAYQVEHHLAPKVPHTHYRTMARRVGAMCDANGLTRRVHASPAAAVRSHQRWLRAMGARPARPLDVGLPLAA
jgi:linoleoyl-CoA desaturase